LSCGLFASHVRGPFWSRSVFYERAAATQRSADRVKIRINYRGVNYGVMAAG